MEGERGPSPDAAGDESEASTLADREWPVDDRYLVEPAAEPTQTEVVPDPAGEAREVAAPAATPPVAGRDPRAPAALIAVVALALLLAAALGAWFVFRPGSNHATSSSSPPPTSASGSQAASSSSSTTTTTTPKTTPAAKGPLTVPDATGLALAEARARLSDAGLRVRVRRRSSGAPVDQVLRQAPDPGSKLERNRFVVLTVSSGPALVALPTLVGLRADAAAQKLRTLDLVPELRLVRSTRSAGTVLAQEPAAGERVPRSSTVRLEVAKHVPKPAPTVVRVQVPDLVGLSASTARRKLTAAGLEAAVVQVTSGESQGTVVRQSPGAGAEVRKGTSVRISVSSGPAPVRVPSVVGLDRQSAEDQLQSAGFEVRDVTESTTDPSQDGLVTAQDPEGGTKAAKGSMVTITVAQLSS